MVRVKFLLTVVYFSAITTVWGQKSDKEIDDFMSIKVSLSSDSIYVGDTLWINLELRNITTKPIKIFPEGILFIEFESPVFDNVDLVQISDRITKRKERSIKPNEFVSLAYPILIKDDLFRKGSNEFRINHITYPYWLSKKERSKKIFGKITSGVSTLYVL